ncbi:hypothetical protein CLOM_g14592 [Closterium sp. NIES-68]|nr:hypothetical protein CLOM_g14592 [Closterium sp. NIES-68]
MPLVGRAAVPPAMLTHSILISLLPTHATQELCSKSTVRQAMLPTMLVPPPAWVAWISAAMPTFLILRFGPFSHRDLTYNNLSGSIPDGISLLALLSTL